MICPKCGAILDEEALNEATENAPEPASGGKPAKGKAPKNKNGKKRNGCAIAGFILSFIPLLNVIGLILSAVGISKAKKLGGRGKGLAIAGLVISILMIVIVLVAAVIFAIIGGASLVAQGCATGMQGACSEMGESCGDSFSQSISSSCGS